MHINRNRQSLGQFSDEEVAEGLKTGRFLPSDLAWQEGMDAWQPLSTFLHLPEVAQGESLAPEVPGTDVLPTWEKPEPIPFFRAAWESTKEILSTPAETFRRMPTSGGSAKPLKFYVWVTWLTSAVAVIYQMVAAAINPALFAGDRGANVSQTMLLMLFGAAIVIMPLLLLVGVFVSAGLVHGALLMVGGARKPFETTLRALCYAGGATSVIQLVPLCGGWVSSIAWLVYSAIALKESHSTDLWRPIAALVLVGLLCCGAVFGIALVTAAAVGAATGALPK
jgi:hypothetical protein